MSSAGPGRREVAHRLFAAEYDDASLEYAESDEERAPNYVVLPGGARVNRLFVVGVLTAVEQVNEDTVRARIADPTGAFVVYAGQYQPDELAALQSLDAPAFVAVTGKANTFSPEGSDRVLTSVRPESVTEVDAETRDRWVVATAEHTLARVQTAAEALTREERGDELRISLVRDGVEPGLAEGIAKAVDHYGTTADYLGGLRDLATQALEVVAGERSEVDSLALEPDDGDGTLSASDLTDLLDDDRLGVTRAAGDVDPEALIADEDGDAAGEEPGAGPASAGGASEPSESAAEEVTDPTSGADEEPVTGETNLDQPAVEAEGATTGEGEPADETEEETEAPGAGPEPSEESDQETPPDEEAVEETAPGEEAADAGGATGHEGAEAENEEAETDDERYEVDEAEREQIEEEHGVEFQSGAEVEPAGEAGIEAEGAPDDVDETAVGTDAEVTETTTDPETERDGVDGESGSADDVDLEAVLLDEMAALDDGDGADREALIDAVAGDAGVDAAAIDDAIDDLLMSGQCYEPSEGTLKPI